jgi:hypothetical protein
MFDDKVELKESFSDNKSAHSESKGIIKIENDKAENKHKEEKSKDLEND